MFDANKSEESLFDRSNWNLWFDLFSAASSFLTGKNFCNKDEKWDEHSGKQEEEDAEEM